MKMSRGKFRKDEILFLMMEENEDIIFCIKQKFFPIRQGGKQPNG